MIDAVNVAPSVSPRAVIPSSSSPSSSSSGIDVSSFRPVLLRVVQTEQRAKKRDENVEERPEDVRDRGGSEERFARPRRPGRGDVVFCRRFRRRRWWCRHLRWCNARDKSRDTNNGLILKRLFKEEEEEDMRRSEFRV